MYHNSASSMEPKLQTPGTGDSGTPSLSAFFLAASFGCCLSGNEVRVTSSGNAKT
jgi:hypothetical protein